MVMGQIGEAMQYLKAGLTICGVIPYDELKIILLFNIAEIYRGVLDENEKALPFYEEILVLTATGDHPLKYVAIAAHKLCLIRMGNREGMAEALGEVTKSIDLIPERRAYLGQFVMISTAYRELNMPDEALDLADRGIKEANQPQDVFARLNLTLIKAQALQIKGDHMGVIKCGQGFFEENKDNEKNPLLLNLYKVLGQAHGSLGNDKEEAKYLNLALLKMEKEMSDHLERHTSILTAEMHQKTLERDLEIHRLKNIELKAQSEALEETAQELQAALDDLMEAQEHLVKTAKLAALGELVVGVAHEINTPLGVGITMASYISDHIDRLHQKFVDRTLKASEIEVALSELSDSVSLLNSGLHRAATIVNSFKQVAIDQSNYECRSFNVSEYLGDIEVMLGPQFDASQFVLKIKCPQDLVITSYPGVFYQVVSQLVNNAITHGYRGCDRVGPDEGPLEVRIIVERLEDQKTLKISVMDYGCGIDQEHLDKIFEPFYTTNKNKGNIGLGLHSLYNLVTQVLKGKIVVEAPSGAGAGAGSGTQAGSPSGAQAGIQIGQQTGTQFSITFVPNT